MSAIRKQVTLPLAVAFEVVLQGVRIRLGRSVVTLLGVVLGIAFLMAILTAQTIRRGVSQEAATRVELKRMVSFLVGDTGPLQGRSVAVLQAGPLNELETRFLLELERSGVASFIRVDGAAANSSPRLALRVPVTSGGLQESAAAAACLLVAGEAPADAVPDLAAVRHGIVALTRKSLLAAPGGQDDVVILERDLLPEEIEQAALEARQGRFRTGWIIIIALLVTVIGISNAMLMSVTERFREIGTMKCLGALSAFIRQVFFIESSLMGLVGSVAGSLFGFAVACGAFAFTYGGELVWAALRPGPLALYLLLSVTAGISLSVVAAIYPASYASRMVPATALRSTI